MNFIFKASSDQEHKDRFKQFLEDESVPLRRAFNQFVQNMLDGVSDRQIQTWIDNKDLRGFLNYASDHIDEMADALPKTFVRAAKSEIDYLNTPGRFGTGKLGVKFDPGSSSAADAMESNRLRFLRDFTANQKDSVRSAISGALRDGDGPVAAARRFRSAIGLTDQQYKAVQSYQSALERGSRNALDRALRDARFDRTVERAITDDDVLSAKQIERMVGRYAENMRNARAETIARTETQRALNQAKQAVWEQTADTLGIDPDKVERVWIATNDARTRDSHIDMHRQTVKGLDTPFEAPSGEELLYPGDPSASAEETINCRCTVIVRFPPSPNMIGK